MTLACVSAVALYILQFFPFFVHVMRMYCKSVIDLPLTLLYFNGLATAAYISMREHTQAHKEWHLPLWSKRTAENHLDFGKNALL